MIIYELYDSYFNLRKNTTLYSKKQLLGFKKDFADISPECFSKLQMCIRDSLFSLTTILLHAGEIPTDTLLAHFYNRAANLMEEGHYDEAQRLSLIHI